MSKKVNKEVDNTSNATSATFTESKAEVNVVNSDDVDKTFDGKHQSKSVNDEAEGAVTTFKQGLKNSFKVSGGGIFGSKDKKDKKDKKEEHKE